MTVRRRQWRRRNSRESSCSTLTARDHCQRMTYRSRGRSLIEVVLVCYIDQGGVFEWCPPLVLGTRHGTASRFTTSSFFLHNDVYESHFIIILISPGNLLCCLFGGIYYSALHRQLLSRQALTRAATPTSTGKISSRQSQWNIRSSRYLRGPEHGQRSTCLSLYC